MANVCKKEGVNLMSIFIKNATTFDPFTMDEIKYTNILLEERTNIDNKVFDGPEQDEFSNFKPEDMKSLLQLIKKAGSKNLSANTDETKSFNEKINKDFWKFITNYENLKFKITHMDLPSGVFDGYPYVAKTMNTNIRIRDYNAEKESILQFIVEFLYYCSEGKTVHLYEIVCTPLVPKVTMQVLDVIKGIMVRFCIEDKELKEREQKEREDY